jgi:hypothetical protein
VTWLTTRHKAMLVQFLDDLGIAHEDGTITGEIGEEPDEVRLRAAVARLRAHFAPAHVRIYLQAFLVTTAPDWERLRALLAE